MGELDFTISRTVGASHITPNGQMRYSAMIDMLQDCEGFQLDSLTLLQDYLRENNIGIFLTSRQLDIKKMPTYAQELNVYTAVYENRAFYGERNTNITSSKGEMLICSYASGAFVKLDTLRPHRMPDEIMSNFTMREKFDMEYLPRKIDVSSCEFHKLGEIKTPRYFLDVYNHVNNARYVDIACEFLPGELSFSRIRIEFKTPAVYGDVIEVFTCEQNGKTIADLRSGSKNYATVEFTI
ncbi:MAG: thioesterase [Oscillospiraceae bacterium]|nr:thioesterase [Oscillospiraceae bacterium]